MFKESGYYIAKLDSLHSLEVLNLIKILSIIYPNKLT